ncbi:hypothetical protein [Streptomyces sp. SID1121]|uniref:hypothetical protein n=1 Tax=Streptomyces sp. SID1121 TaxID=3425888 RepID=UPI0040571C65
MPAFKALPRFTTDLSHLTPARHRRFLHVVRSSFVTDLRTGSRFRPGLRVKGVRCAPGVFELTWNGDGRATFSYGKELLPGERHIIWRRVGTHDILTGP